MLLPAHLVPFPSVPSPRGCSQNTSHFRGQHQAPPSRHFLVPPLSSAQVEASQAGKAGQKLCAGILGPARVCAAEACTSVCRWVPSSKWSSGFMTLSCLGETYGF